MKSLWKIITCLLYYGNEALLVTGYSHNAFFFFSSPEHEVLRVSYCDSAVSVINFLACGRSRGHIFSPIVMKLGQDV